MGGRVDRKRAPYLACYALALLPIAAGFVSELAPSQVGDQRIVAAAGTMGPMQLVAFHHYALYFEACLPMTTASYDLDASVGQQGGSPFTSGRWPFRASDRQEWGCQVRLMMMAFEPPTTGDFEVWWSVSGNITGTGAHWRMQESVLAPGAGVLVAGFGFVVLGLAAALDVRRAVIAKRPRPPAPTGPPVGTVPCPACGYRVFPAFAVCPNCRTLMPGR
jgi:hypothetical protein